MSNEILLVISLVVAYGSLFIFFSTLKRTGCYVWIAICTIFANIEVVILVNAFCMEQTLGNTLFASSFLATDFLSEFYGKKSAQKGAIVGIATSLVFILFSFLWTKYTPSANDISMIHIVPLFSNTPRILCASLFSYAVASFVDVQLYHAWWQFTENRTKNKNKFLWLRNNASTLSSQFINIVLFNVGAFWGVYDLHTLISITATCYVIYIFTSILDTPFIYLARRFSQ